MIYMVRAEGTSLYKIGFAADPAKRMAELQTGCPHTLHLVATGPGDLNREAALHRMLGAHHFRGEWFEICETAERFRIMEMVEDCESESARRTASLLAGARFRFRVGECYAAASRKKTLIMNPAGAVGCPRCGRWGVVEIVDESGHIREGEAQAAAPAWGAHVRWGAPLLTDTKVSGPEQEFVIHWADPSVGHWVDLVSMGELVSGSFGCGYDGPAAAAAWGPPPESLQPASFPACAGPLGGDRGGDRKAASAKVGQKIKRATGFGPATSSLGSKRASGFAPQNPAKCGTFDGSVGPKGDVE